MELQTESLDDAMETDTPPDVSCDIQPSADSLEYNLSALCVSGHLIIILSWLV